MPWSPSVRVLPTLVAVTLALGAAAVGAAATAQASVAPVSVEVAFLPAHAQLLGTTPEDGSTEKAVSEVVLSFNEDVNPDFVKVVVKGPDGAEADGDPVVGDTDVTQALSADLPAGAHTVTYRVVSSDGHPVSGSFAFTTTSSPTPSETPTPSPTSSSESSVSATPSTSPTTEPSPSTTASPATDQAGDSSPSTAVWVIIGAVAFALLATVVAVAARRRDVAP